MKNIINSILIIALSLIYCTNAKSQEKSNFSLSGQTATKQNWIYLSYLNDQEKRITDSTLIKNGSFRFTGRVNGAANANLYEQKTDKNQNSRINTSFYIEPGDLKIEFDNKKKQNLISGFKIEADITRLNNLKKDINTALQNVNMQLDSVNQLRKHDLENKEFHLAKANLLSKKNGLYKNRQLIDSMFMIANPKSQINPNTLSYYVGTRKINIDISLQLFNQFDPSVRNSFDGKKLLREINGIKNTQIGLPAPVFSKTDIEGKLINSFDFINKKVLILDFWASWCVPCRVLTPNMKLLYEQYQPKGLEIISISWDADSTAWKKAIIDDGTNAWINIRASMNEPKDFSMRDLFGIESIPAILLIDRDGKIIGRYLTDHSNGDEKELALKLKEIFTSK